MMSDWADEIAIKLADQMELGWDAPITKLAAALRKARADALEEAAIRCDMEANSDRYPMTNNVEQAHKETARLLADAIIALKDKQP